jgi:hypothetical protein
VKNTLAHFCNGDQPCILTVMTAYLTTVTYRERFPAKRFEAKDNILGVKEKSICLENSIFPGKNKKVDALSSYGFLSAY